MKMSNDISKFLNLDDFINSNIDFLSKDEYEFLCGVLQALVDIILKDEH